MVRPFIFINAAMTADGKLDTFNRKGARISSSTDKERVLKLRSDSDAVMVGGHTLIAEDPDLTVKTEKLRKDRIARGLSENPAKVGVVTSADINPGGKFMTTGPAEKYIFTTSRTRQEQLDRLQSAGAHVFVNDGDLVDLPGAMEILAATGIQRLMVEGGGGLNSELLRLGLVDEIQLYIAPVIFGGQTSPTLVNGEGFMLDDAVEMELLDTQILDDNGGIFIKYRVKNRVR